MLHNIWRTRNFICFEQGKQFDDLGNIHQVTFREEIEDSKKFLSGASTRGAGRGVNKLTLRSNSLIKCRKEITLVFIYLKTSSQFSPSILNIGNYDCSMNVVFRKMLFKVKVYYGKTHIKKVFSLRGGGGYNPLYH